MSPQDFSCFGITDAALRPPTKNEVVIDPEGDAYLDLGTTELKVSSKVLSVASKVFNRVFSPRWETTKPAGGPRHIELPEDDPEAMTAVCRILHYHSDLVGTKQTIEFLEKMAIVSDKYDCIPAILPWSKSCFNEMFDTKTPSKLDFRLLVLIIAFNDPIHFNEFVDLLDWSIEETPLPGIDEGFEHNIPEELFSFIPEGLIGRKCGR